MSIQLSNLSKYYGKQKAISNLSADIPSEQIVGLLGPNGAGKTTLMKILTAYLLPDQGNARICNIDVEKKPMDIKKKVGYLPEHNPLYLDMYVKEYLEFAGRFYMPEKEAQERASALIEKVGITSEYKKKIGALSKGYRQRVGLAQALLHDPEVLILDEPTSGLDPNQIEEVRLIIREMGKKKTVLLSTHIMQEVEAICDRVLILNKGELVLDDSVEKIKEKYQCSLEKIFQQLTHG